MVYQKMQLKADTTNLSITYLPERPETAVIEFLARTYDFENKGTSKAMKEMTIQRKPNIENFVFCVGKLEPEVRRQIVPYLEGLALNTTNVEESTRYVGLTNVETVAMHEEMAHRIIPKTKTTIEEAIESFYEIEEQIEEAS